MPCNSAVCDCHDGEPKFIPVDYDEPSPIEPSILLPKAYIAGPVRGNPDYHQHFRQAAQIMENRGYNAINPMEGPDMSQDEINDYIARHWTEGTIPPYIMTDIAHILTLVGKNGDIVVTLPNWQESPGARAEVALAEWIGVKVMSIDEFLPDIRLCGYTPTGELTARDRLLSIHNEMCGEARALMARKNHDYASDADPFRNFRTFGRFGILVRLSDKLARLRSFEEQQTLDVPEESIRDTVQDIINYAILYIAYE